MRCYQVYGTVLSVHSTVLFVVYSTAKRKVTVVYKVKLIIALLCIFVTQQMSIALLLKITVVIFYSQNNQLKKKRNVREELTQKRSQTYDIWSEM